MNYMGSKNRIAKHILPIMLSNRKKGQIWVEPFVGGGNMIDKVEGMRIGADANKWAIEALAAIRDHVSDLPRNNTEFTEEDYKKLRESDDYRFKGYAGFAFSFGAKWMGGWARNSNDEDYIELGLKNAKAQSPKLKGVKLIHSSYDKLEIPPDSLIYCDPPYQDTTSYKTGDFDHEKFWQWARCVNENHTVFVSEYRAPSDFECIWEKEVVSSLTEDTGAKRATERLFVHKTQKTYLTPLEAMLDGFDLMI